MGSDLTLRRARLDDRPAIERICAHTWDWGDYIPDVWDDWLADEHGVVLLGEIERQVVALSKITFQTPDQVWLEGMRVHPEYRQQGIASRFLNYCLDYGSARRVRVVRLATSSRNVAAHTIVSRAGMGCIGRYVLWTADPAPEVNSPAVLASLHAAKVRAFLDDSRVLSHTQRLYSTGWAWQELTAGRVVQMLSSGKMVAEWASDGGLAALATIQFDPEDSMLWIGFADGFHGEQARERPSSLTALAVAIRGLAAQATPEGAEIGKVRIMLADLDWLQEAFRTAGYGPGDWEGELWIFERRLDNHAGDSHED